MQTGATFFAKNSQQCWMLHVASVCLPCYMLSDVVACCCAKFETSQTSSPMQTDTALHVRKSKVKAFFIPFMHMYISWVKLLVLSFRLAKSGLSFEAMFEEIPLVIRNSSLVNTLLCEIEVLSPHTQTDEFLSLSTG